MTDITKCRNGCKHRESCYRWTAPSSEYQYYADFQPENGECEYYWPTHGTKKEERREA